MTNTATCVRLQNGTRRVGCRDRQPGRIRGRLGCLILGGKAIEKMVNRIRDKLRRLYLIRFFHLTGNRVLPGIRVKFRMKDYQEDETMDFLNGKIKTIYFKYLSAAFGSALITSIYEMIKKQSNSEQRRRHEK